MLRQGGRQGKGLHRREARDGPPVQAVILELLESTLTRSVLLKHGLRASSVSLKVGALYAQCFPRGEQR